MIWIRISLHDSYVEREENSNYKNFILKTALVCINKFTSEMFRQDYLSSGNAPVDNKWFSKIP